MVNTLFAWYGIPSNNGPQFSFQEFTKFGNRYQFTHKLAAPIFLTGYGQEERAVQRVKHLLRSTDDPSLALLSYTTTPLPWCERSPAEVRMGRKIRSTLPQTLTV